MHAPAFEDHYETLQVSPNADSDTIGRIFRHLAKRYHPDNPQTGNASVFDRISKAYRVLSDADRRAGYDAQYQTFWKDRWQISQEASDGNVLSSDQEFRIRALSLFYVKRRRDTRHAGMGSMEVARLLDCPHELVDFHVWYLKEKGWVTIDDSGLYSITAQGVDQVEAAQPELSPDRLISEKGAGGSSEDGVGKGPRHLRAVLGW